MYRWKPSKSARVEFAKKMDEIDDFCLSNGINHSVSSDSYYFCLNGKDYRVSNHTVEASDKGMYDDMFGKVRESYHKHDDPDMIYITAGKTRLIEIYKDLEAGYELDKRGFRKE